MLTPNFVTFEVNEQTVKAHKNILAARLPFFNAQFYGPLWEVSDTIKIEGTEAPVFSAILEFILIFVLRCASSWQRIY